FALGAVIVHAATGRGPFDSDSPYIVAYQVVHDQPDLGGVPEELTPLVARCLAKDPAERPTPDEVMAALGPPSYEAEAFVPAQRRAVVAAAVPAVPDGERHGSEEDTHVRAAPPVRRRRLPRARLVVAAAVLLLVAGAGAGAYAVWG
ncbi:serine/threonine protein kinase, partial [Streptomyces sp. MBT54]|nr:serine/threonine protein kinase [Streptomyces sp. MBT54]